MFGNKPLYKDLHTVNKTAKVLKSDFQIQSIINAKNLSGNYFHSFFVVDIFLITNTHDDLVYVMIRHNYHKTC